MLAFLMGYEYLDMSGEAGVRATGRTLQELFESAALGMYGLVADTENIEEKEEAEISIQSHSIEGLLVQWLNELIFKFDAYGFLGRSVKVNSLDDREYRLEATVRGEEFDPDRHEGKLLVKAATYHNLQVVKDGGEWSADVVFDI